VRVSHAIGALIPFAESRRRQRSAMSGTVATLTATAGMNHLSWVLLSS
jgi:hypothetical protein